MQQKVYEENNTKCQMYRLQCFINSVSSMLMTTIFQESSINNDTQCRP